MALSRTWYTDANVAVSDFSTALRLAQSILWGLKAILKGEISGTNGPDGAPPVGSRWTCEGSSDSVTAGMDASDRWTATFDDTKIVRNTPGSAHSWIVLKSPTAAGPLYMMLDWSSGSNTTCVYQFSYNPFTGGSITVAPTSTGAWSHTTDGGGSLWPFNDGTANAHRLHRVTDADGNFWFFTSKNTTGIFHFALGLQKLVNPRVGDSKTSFSFVHFRSTDRGAGHFGANAPNGTFGDGNGLLNSNTNVIVVGGRTFDNLSAFKGGVLSPALGYSAGNNVATLGGTIDSFQPQLNAADSTWDFYPFWIYCNVSLKSGIRGEVPDANLVIGSGPAIGAGVPTAASMERMVVGCLIIPFSVIPLL